MAQREARCVRVHMLTASDQSEACLLFARRI